MVMEQLIYYLMVIFENSVWLFGNFILSKMLGPIVDKISNDYQMTITLPSPFRGQNTRA